MAQPPSFSASVLFQQEESNQVSGRSMVRTAALDATIAAIAETLAALRGNIAVIQRDDGEIRDAMVKLHTLSAEVLALIASSAFLVRGPWATATVYAKGDIASSANVIYMAMTAHTSAVFAADLADGYWAQLTANQAASSTVFSPTANLVSENVQAAIEEVDAAVRPSLNWYKRITFGGL